jgi:hypothetical protein
MFSRNVAGKEFYNKDVKSYLKELGVTLFSTENSDIKASIAENAIRTIKAKIWRYMRSMKTTKFYDQLENIVQSKNESISRTHHMRPNDVSEENSLKVFNALYDKLLKANVSRVVRHRPQPVYHIVDLSGEPILGGFYSYKLSRVRKSID